MDTTERMIEERIDALLDERQQASDLIERTRQRIRGIDDDLRAERLALRGARKKSRKRVRVTPERTPERQAGPTAIRRVEEVLSKHGGRATQHEITEETGINSGTISYALRALQDRGRVRTTGERIRRSPVVELVGDTVRMPPGSGKQR